MPSFHVVPEKHAAGGLAAQTPPCLGPSYWNKNLSLDDFGYRLLVDKREFAPRQGMRTCLNAGHDVLEHACSTRGAAVRVPSVRTGAYHATWIATVLYRTVPHYPYPIVSWCHHPIGRKVIPFDGISQLT